MTILIIAFFLLVIFFNPINGPLFPAILLLCEAFQDRARTHEYEQRRKQDFIESTKIPLVSWDKRIDLIFLEREFKRLVSDSKKIDGDFLYDYAFPLLNGDDVGKDEFERYKINADRDRHIRELGESILLLNIKRLHVKIGQYDFQKKHIPIFIGGKVDLDIPSLSESYHPFKLYIFSGNNLELMKCCEMYGGYKNYRLKSHEAVSVLREGGSNKIFPDLADPPEYSFYVSFSHFEAAEAMEKAQIWKSNFERHHNFELSGLKAAIIRPCLTVTMGEKFREDRILYAELLGLHISELSQILRVS